jgi:dihydroorotate dehydrogenase electron transfer subunit
MSNSLGRAAPRFIEICPVGSVREVGKNIFVLQCRSRLVAAHVLPGQFINIRIKEGQAPLLRRPFSVYRTEGEVLEIIFNVVGAGTRILSEMRPGDSIDVLGPLGTPYNTEGGYDTAILVAGGLGVAPFPITTAFLQRNRKRIVTLLGARSVNQIVSDHLENVVVATDDGSGGVKGTVVKLLEQTLRKETLSSAKVFACGPNAMLKALQSSVRSIGVDCEISLECEMACGFGICQGCPVEVSETESDARKYRLVCKDGPVFNAESITIAV